MFKMYGANWCGDCKRIKFFLDQHNYTQYAYIDVDEDDSASKYVISVNPEGNRSIPVLEFDDGEIMIEPSIAAVAKKLEIDL